MEQSRVRDGDQGRRQDPRETRSRSGALEPAQQTGHRGEMRADPPRHDPPSFFGNPRLQLSHSNHCLTPTLFLSNLRLQLTRPTHTEFSLYPVRVVP